ncbi:unnamed protein product, partial [marine sediment metagenome]
MLLSPLDGPTERLQRLLNLLLRAREEEAVLP